MKEPGQNLGRIFYEFMHIPVIADQNNGKLVQLVNERLQKLNSVDEEFRKLWIQIGEEVEDRITDRLAQSDSANLKEILREEKYKLLVQLMRDKGFIE